MSHYTKERNIITFNLDGINGQYKLDINTGIFYGAKGNPIKVNRYASAMRNLMDNRENDWSTTKHHLEYVLYDMFRNGATALYPRYLNRLRAAERLDALGFEGFLVFEYYEDIDKNFAEFVAYLKTELEPNEKHSYSGFCAWKRHKEWQKKFGSIIDNVPKNIIQTIMNNRPHTTAEDMSIMLYYLVRGKMWEYERGNISKLLNYFDICEAMDKTPQKVNNFMREWYETNETYRLRKTEFDDKRIQKNYAERKEEFTFTYGNYTVVCPTCAKDIIDEGDNMHHCVGSYVESVVHKNTYIVFIRPTDKPDQCYITCQVHTNGAIGQYYLAYDNTIRKTEDREFYQAFQLHLKANWKN